MPLSHIIISASDIFFLYFAPELDAKFALTEHKHGGKARVTVSKEWLIIIFNIFSWFKESADIMCGDETTYLRLRLEPSQNPDWELELTVF